MAADLKIEPLPPDWSYGVTNDGRVFFISERHRETSWLHPLAGRPVQTGHQNSHGLPDGWEQDFTPDGVVYFIDMIQHERANNKSNQKRKPASPKKRIMKAPSAKRNPGAQVVRRGYLYHLENSGIARFWKKRWCVLADFALFIYKSNDERADLRSILLPGYRISQCSLGDPIQKTFSFKIEHENTRTEYFHTDSMSDLLGWLADLQMMAIMNKNTGLSLEANNNGKPTTANTARQPPPLSPHISNNTNRLPHNIIPDTHAQNRSSDLAEQTNPKQGVRKNSSSSFPSIPDNQRDSRDPRNPQETEHSPHGGGQGGPTHGQLFSSGSGQQMHGDRVPTAAIPMSYSSLPRNFSESARGFQASVPGREGHQPSGRLHRAGHKSSKIGDLKQRDNHSQGQGRSGQLQRDADASFNDQRMNVLLPSYGTQTSDAGQSNRLHDGGQWYNVRSQHLQPQLDRNHTTGSHTLPRNYKEGNTWTDNRNGPGGGGRHALKHDTVHRLNTSRDSQGSSSNSQHSAAIHNYRVTTEHESSSSRQNVWSNRENGSSVSGRAHHTSTSSHHSAFSDSNGHTYVNVPDVRQAVKQSSDSRPPERPPYPAEMRHQIMADVLQKSSCSQHYTTVGGSGERLSESKGRDSLQRVSQHSNYNSLSRSSTSAISNHSSSSIAKLHPGFAEEFTTRTAGQNLPSNHLSRCQDHRDGGVSNAHTNSVMNVRDLAADQRYTFSPVAEDVTASGGHVPVQWAEPSSQDVNFFEHSLNSQTSSFSQDKQVFSTVPGPWVAGEKVKPKFAVVERVSSVVRDREVEMSHNTTLSPSGSYHHIDRDLDELYRRGSAFRPPSSTSGSFGGDTLFHSLPRSYKFKSIPDAVKEAFPEVSSRSELSFIRNDLTENGVSSTEDLDWYRAHYLSSQTIGNTSGEDQPSERGKHPRSISDLGFPQQGKWPVHPPPYHRAVAESQELQPPPKPMRSSLRRSDAEPGGCSDGRYGSKGSLTQYEPQLQSWPRQDLTARQLDVPTPSSLSSHPFFVPDDPPTSPPPRRKGEVTVRDGKGKDVKADCGDGVYAKLQGGKDLNRHPIQTVREDPDMPDNEVLETKQQKKDPLNGTRLRMSISAGDLIGKTQDELVLLLISLRRNQAALNKARDFYRESLYKRRPAEREYWKQRQACDGKPVDHLEESHQNFVDVRSQLEEVDKKLEVYRPLINLIDNMVTMGSLYGGDNLMLATQYRKHLLRPEQYQAPRELLEFARQHQEQKMVRGIQNDVRHLTAAEVDLEDKTERLSQLERLVQEQSFKVSSFREDKELLEKALQGIQRQVREGQDSPTEASRLQQQQTSVEKELSRVTQELAIASKALEETSVENNKVAHDVALLRTRVRRELKRSKSAPSLGLESVSTKEKMERELARVQDLLQGLSQQGERLSQQMSSIRRSSSGTRLAAAFDEAEQMGRVGRTYLQTDMDSGQQVDLAQQIRVQLHTSSSNTIRSDRGQTEVLQNSSVMTPRAGLDTWVDDDSYRPLYGSLPRDKSRGLTVRDVKRQLVQRREKKRDEDGADVPLSVSLSQSDAGALIHARFPSYASSQSSGLDLALHAPQGRVTPIYENLPRSGSMPSLCLSNAAPGVRKSSLTLMTPRPFTPYEDVTAKRFRSELDLNNGGQGGGFASSEGSPVPKAFSKVRLTGGRKEDWMRYTAARSSVDGTRSLDRQSFVVGQVGMMTSHPPGLGQSMEGVTESAMTQSSALPPHTGLPLHVSQKTPNTRLSRLQGQQETETSPSDTTPPPRDTDSTGLPPNGLGRMKMVRSRHLTVSSSQPARMEASALRGCGHSSLASGLMAGSKIDDVPDVVKSSLTNVDKIDHLDRDVIDREVLYLPDKVTIPERYDAEADAEELTEEERQERRQKAERIKHILTRQSSLSVAQAGAEEPESAALHQQFKRDKEERAHILTLNQELARQVTLRSKKAAAERRKTWSGDQFSHSDEQYQDLRNGQGRPV